MGRGSLGRRSSPSGPSRALDRQTQDLPVCGACRCREFRDRLPGRASGWRATAARARIRGAVSRLVQRHCVNSSGGTPPPDQPRGAEGALTGDRCVVDDTATTGLFSARTDHDHARTRTRAGPRPVGDQLPPAQRIAGAHVVASPRSSGQKHGRRQHADWPSTARRILSSAIAAPMRRTTSSVSDALWRQALKRSRSRSSVLSSKDAVTASRSEAMLVHRAPPGMRHLPGDGQGPEALWTAAHLARSLGVPAARGVPCGPTASDPGEPAAIGAHGTGAKCGARHTHGSFYPNVDT